jgi:hypothetical protein
MRQILQEKGKEFFTIVLLQHCIRGKLAGGVHSELVCEFARSAHRADTWTHLGLTLLSPQNPSPQLLIFQRN